jgi:peptidoglycan/xylan/chitin deacetylase (PgdA/CDA1 family)
MHKAYLTIDDGPSERFTDLVNFLNARKIPAVFFNRGDCMDERPGPVMDAIQKGFIIANHSYSHQRASKISLAEMQNEITRTDKIIDDLYQRAGVKRPGKYFRFPYMDRGMGAAFDENPDLPPDYARAHMDLLTGGLGHTPTAPPPELIAKKNAIQNILQGAGYTALPTPGVTIPWYAQTQMARAVDSLCTYSTSDWALLARHKGKHAFSSAQDLKNKIDTDEWIFDESSNHIILAHDQAEIHDVTIAVIEHFLNRGFKFMDFPLSNP